MRSLALLLGAAAIVVCALWAMLHNAWMTRQLLQVVPGLTVTAPQGALLGDFQAQQLAVALPRGGQLLLDQPAWTGLALRWDAAAPWQFGLYAEQLGAKRLALQWVAGPPEPAAPLQAPADLVLPVSLEVTRLRIDALHSNVLGDVPVSDLDAAVHLQGRGQKAGEAGLVEHRVTVRRLAVQGWALSGDARVQARGDMGVAADITAIRPDGPVAGRVTLSANGPLQQVAWQAAANLMPPGKPAAEAQARGTLQPFAPWALHTLEAELKGVDLSLWHAGWPRTALDARLAWAPVQQAEGLRAEVALSNAVAGPWDAGRVPVRALRGTLQSAAMPGSLPWRDWLAGLALDLQATLPVSADRSGEATVSIQGQPGQPEGLSLRWQGLDARALHGAAPDLLTQATVSLRPEWRDQALSSLTVEGEVQGTHGRAAQAQAVRLTLDARHEPGVVQVRVLRLRAGVGQAELTSARLQWQEVGTWQGEATARFQALDPSVWLPWPAAVQGRHALQGRLSVSVDADWRGQADLQLDDSVLAGVPLAGQLQWRSPRDVQRMTVAAQLRAGGNAAELKGTVPWRRDASGGWQMDKGADAQLQLQAPVLAALAPLAPLWQGQSLQGRLVGEARFQGGWPELETSGQLQADGVQHVGVGGERVQLTAASAQWAWKGGQAQAPVSLQARIQGLSLQGAQVDEATLAVDGTVGAHQGRWQVEAWVPPAASGPNAGGGKPAEGKRWRALGALQGQGRWQPELADWQGHLRDVRVTQETPAVREWLRVADLPLAWRRDAATESWRVGEASLEVAGLSLRLAQATGQRPLTAAWPDGQLQADLALAPFNVARWQAGWRLRDDLAGDLVVAGSVRLRHSPEAPWQMRAELARQSGDLSVIESAIQGGQAQRLGIRQAVLTLQAERGVWTMTQLLDGRTLGLVQGQQVVRVDDPHRWPVASDTVAGDLVLKVESLRPWGNWLPAGWRLGGRLEARAQVGGTLAAPRFSGRVTGDGLSASQLLEGISVSQGRLVLELEGDRARLLEFSLQDGAGGQLRATGQAELGEQPQARIDVTATRFAALQRVDRRVVVSGQVQAQLVEEAVQARGQIRVDEGLIDISRSDAPTIGDDVRVVNRPGQPDDPGEGASRGGRDAQRQVDVAIGIDLGERLRLRGRGLEATLAGQLRFTTPAGRPSLSGTVNVREGVYAAYGQRLVIDRGGITFSGPIENPRLDLRAMRAQSPAAKADDVKVGVSITGTAQDPRVRLYSEPAMADTEKLSWLLLGRAPTGLDGADIGLLQTAAVALLSGEGGGPSDTVVSRLGLDELSIRQTDGTVRDTVVNVGKQVSERWYIGYERNLNATAGNWQLIYRVAQRFTLRAQAGEDNALDLIWQFRWRGREQLDESGR